MFVCRWLSKLIVLLTLTLLTCCSSTDHTSVSTRLETENPFKVGLLLPHSIEQDSWSRAGYEGLEMVEGELGAQVAYTASVSEAEMESVFRQYARDDFDFIIGLGQQFIPAARMVADEFPQTQFAVVARYAGNNNNLGALSFRDSEMGYLAGAVAGLKTSTNHVSFIGGLAYPHVREQSIAFRAGAHATNPSVIVSTGWIGSWNDNVRAREIARARVEAGADVLVLNAGQSDMTILHEAQQSGVYVIGWLTDGYRQAPETIITSAIQHIPVLLLEGSILAQQGYWQGKLYRFGLQENSQELAPFRGALTPEEEQQIDAITRDLIEGKIDAALE